MKYLSSFFVAVLIFSASAILAQDNGAPPKLVTATPRPSPSQSRPPAPARTNERPRPSKEILERKWPSPDKGLEVPSMVDARAAELQAKFEKARSLLAERKAADALPILVEAQKLDAERFEIQQLLGICYAMLGRVDDAVRTFQKAVKLAPQNPAARFALCQSLSDSSRMFEAIDECREAVRLDPKQKTFTLALTELYLKSDMVREAGAFLEGAISDQNDLLSKGLLADTYFLGGEYLRAAELYERIAADWPKVSVTYYRLSRVYEYLERPQEAITAARRYVELEPRLIDSHINLGERLKQAGFFFESIDALNKAIVLEPKAGYAALMLADNYSIVGDHESSMANLKIAYANLPRTSDLDRQIGYALFESRAYAEAIGPLERANANEPDRADTMRMLGLAYIYTYRYDEGKTLIDRANQISPLPPGFSMNFMSAGERDKMLERFDYTLAFVEKNPKNVEARRYLVNLYRLKRMPVEAEKHFVELTKLRSDDPVVYNELAVFYSDLGQSIKAVDAIRNAIRLMENHVFYMILCWELRRLGRLDEALEAAGRAAEVKPDSVETRIGYGELLQKKGRRADALREFQAAFELASGDRRPNFRLAWLYILMGNKDGAFRHYSILKGIAPNEVKWLEQCLMANFGTLR